MSYKYDLFDQEELNLWDTVSTIQYMGSKTRILSNICPEFLAIDGIDTFIDLFAGTGSVSYALKNHLKIFSNDLQLYSAIINKAILNGASITEEEEFGFFKEAEEIYGEITNTIDKAIKKEDSFFCSSTFEYQNYQQLCDETPNVFSPISQITEYQSLSKICKEVLVGRPQSQQKTKLPVLFLTYYANTYFGIRQCCEIDALRGTIEKISDSRQQNVLLAALMSAMSITVSATTHFAQYLKVRDINTAKSLLDKRQRSLFDVMREKLNEFRQKGILSQQTSSATCGNLDYLEFLNQVPLGENTLVYADPPYFKEHYSRYYHVLETVCLYDYPEVTFNSRLNGLTAGRYRSDRATSPFGKKSHALGAFNALIETCSVFSAPIAISYADNSIVDFEEIKNLMSVQYDVATKLIPLKHSNQGRSTSNNQVNEVLIIGMPKQKTYTIGQMQVNNVLKKLESMESLYDNPAGAMHNYMARKPYNILNEIIGGLTREQGVVLDPFCGSGTTLIESRKLGHNAIGVDLNTQAILISKVSLGAWNMEKVERELSAFGTEINLRIKDLYEIKYDDSTRFVERCHFDLVSDKLVPTSYKYKELLNDGKLGPRKLANMDSVFLENYAHLEKQAGDLFKDKMLLPNSRIAVAQGATVADYFCARNKLAVKRILDVLLTFKGYDSYPLMELVVSSALNLIKLSDKKASSQMPYWRPSKDITSRNAVWIIQEKIESIKEGAKFLSKQFTGCVVDSFKKLSVSNASLLIKSPIQKVPARLLPNSSVDLVVTDPPYTDQVPYLEYSQLWALLLGWDNLSEASLSNEIVVSNSPYRKSKTFLDYYTLMSDMFQRVSKAMKPYSHLAMFFHDFSLNAWSSIVRSAEEAGLAYQGQSRIGRQRRSFKTVMSPNRTLDGNYLVVFRKRAIHPPIYEGTLETAVERCEAAAKKIIRENGGRATSQDLYDKGLLKDSIESGSLHLLASRYKTFLDIIKSKFHFTDGYWSEK